MILKNKTAGLIVANNPEKGVNVVLIPGNNDIPAVQYDVVKESLKFEIEHELVEEVNVEVKDGKTIVIPFEKLSVAKAGKIIEGTTSLETLEAWLAVETRPDVRVQIQNKIEAVKSYAGPGSEDKK